MDLLIFLVRENGRLFGRGEIIDPSGRKDIYFDTDNSIKTAICKLRRALGDDPKKPHHSETELWKGYRFKGGTGAAPGMTLPREESEKYSSCWRSFPSKPERRSEHFSDALTEETIVPLKKCPRVA